MSAVPSFDVELARYGTGLDRVLAALRPLIGLTGRLQTATRMLEISGGFDSLGSIVLYGTPADGHVGAIINGDPSDLCVIGRDSADGDDHPAATMLCDALHQARIDWSHLSRLLATPGFHGLLVGGPKSGREIFRVWRAPDATVGQSGEAILVALDPLLPRLARLGRTLADGEAILLASSPNEVPSAHERLAEESNLAALGLSVDAFERLCNGAPGDSYWLRRDGDLALLTANIANSTQEYTLMAVVDLTVDPNPIA